MEHSIATQDFTPSAVPPELISLHQWVGWEYAEVKKRPLDPATGEGADTTDPGTWGTFTDADALFERVGFVFTEDDPYCGIDFDNCGDRATGYLHPAVVGILDQLGNPYAEWSPSGAGIKAWVRATKPGTRCSTRNTPWGGKIEMYDRGRFFAITGDVVLREGPIGGAQEAVDGLYERFLGEGQQAVVAPLTRRSSEVSLSDDEVMEKARNCRKTGTQFSDLYDHGSSVPRGKRSEADSFVCWCLARASFGDAEQVKRLFRLSDAARGKFREKGHLGEDYLDRTVGDAVRRWGLTHDPNYGERLREKVGTVVRDHRERLDRSDLKGSRRAVMEEMMRIAEEVGSLTKRGVTFNANQYAIGEAVGVSQKTVSRIIRELVTDGRIKRTSKGSKAKGKNSTYRLPVTNRVTPTLVVGEEGSKDEI